MRVATLHMFMLRVREDDLPSRDPRDAEKERENSVLMHDMEVS